MWHLPRKLREIENTIVDCRASSELSRFGLGYIPWSRAALRPSALLAMLNEVAINQRKTVVELGSGVSTVYLAKLLSKTGGRLISIEHEPSWQHVVSGMLASQSLSETVELASAPLRQCPFSAGGLEWYDIDVIGGVLGNISIDMLIVDGPPAYESTKALARYPAFPALQRNFSERFAIFLDDIDRPGEREIVKRWERESDLKFQLFLGKGNYAFATRGNAFYSAP